MITIVSRRKSWSVQDMINDHVVQWLLPLTIELDIDKYTKYWHTKKWLQISQIGKMQYKVWPLPLLHCSALVWVFSRTNSHVFILKVFLRINFHAFLFKVFLKKYFPEQIPTHFSSIWQKRGSGRRANYPFKYFTTFLSISNILIQDELLLFCQSHWIEEKDEANLEVLQLNIEVMLQCVAQPKFWNLKPCLWSSLDASEAFMFSKTWYPLISLNWKLRWIGCYVIKHWHCLWAKEE